MLQPNPNGFTLIELSIVLVIVGLLVGGVLTGRDLIRAAEVRAQLAQIESFNTAATTYREKYDALPGDDRYAVGRWGARANDPDLNVCMGAAPSGTSTCGGNGDHQIQAASENMLFWEHLILAGYYNGRPSAPMAYGDCMNTTQPDHAVCFTRSKLSPSVWVGMFSSSLIFPGEWLALGAPEGNYFSLGSDFSGEDGQFLGPGVPAAAASAIDRKVDDGRPMSGSVSVSPFNGASGDCADAGAPPSYLVPQTAEACALMIMGAF